MTAASSHSATSARSEINDQPRRPTLKPRAGALTACRMEELGIELRVAAEKLRATYVNQQLRQLLGRARFRTRPRRWDTGAIVGLDRCELGIALRPNQIADAVPCGVGFGENGIALLDDGKESGDLCAFLGLRLFTPDEPDERRHGVDAQRF